MTLSRREFLILGSMAAVAALTSCTQESQVAPTTSPEPSPTNTLTPHPTEFPSITPSTFPTQYLEPTPDRQKIIDQINPWFSSIQPEFIPTSETLFGYQANELLIDNTSSPRLLAFNTDQGWVLNIPRSDTSLDPKFIHSLIDSGYGLDTLVTQSANEVIANTSRIISKDANGIFFEFSQEALLRFSYNRWIPWVETELGERTFFPALIADANKRGFYGYGTSNNQLMFSEIFMSPQIHLQLTVDDGFWPENTRAILDLAQENSWRISFYLNTNYLTSDPQIDVLTRIFSEGHELGFHTGDHKKYGWSSTQDLFNDLVKFESFVKQVEPSYKVKTMRPPFGYWNQDWINLSIQAGIPTILWNYYNEDNIDPKVHIPKTINAGQSSIVLLHTRPECVTWLQDNREMLNNLISQDHQTTTTIDSLVHQGKKVELIGYPSM